MKLNYINHGSDAALILDWSRFIAALIVFVYHLTGKTIIPGYQAVMVFFVLSGFFISSSVLNSIISGKWSWKYYLVSRITRLWVVLIPALILSAIWVNAQIHFLGLKSLPAIVTGEFRGSISIYSLIQNLFFLQGPVGHDLFGLNGPLWSLSFEFWYYILFPVMILTFKSNSIYKRLGYGMFFIILSIFLGVHIMAYYVIWLIGALVVILKPLPLIKKHSKFYMISSFMLTLISFHLLYYIFHAERPHADMLHYLPDLSVAICFALFVYVSINLFSERVTFGKMGHIGTYLAGMAYTLYLVHYPVLNLIGATNILTKSHAFIKLLYYAGIFIAILVYSDLISHVTERHTAQIKKWVLGLSLHKIIITDKADS